MYWMYPCLASSSRNPAGFLISMFSKTIKSVHETHRVLGRVPANHTPPSTFRRGTCLTVSTTFNAWTSAVARQPNSHNGSSAHILSPKHWCRRAAESCASRTIGGRRWRSPKCTRGHRVALRAAGHASARAKARGRVSQVRSDGHDRHSRV